MLDASKSTIDDGAISLISIQLHVGELSAKKTRDEHKTMRERLLSLHSSDGNSHNNALQNSNHLEPGKNSNKKHVINRLAI